MRPIGFFTPIQFIVAKEVQKVQPQKSSRRYSHRRGTKCIITKKVEKVQPHKRYRRYSRKRGT